MPGSGELVERISLRRRGGTEDAYGNTVPGDFDAKFERRAQFIMKPGSETVLAARLQGQQPVTIIVRFDSETSAVTPEWEVVDLRTNAVYSIQAAADMDRRRQWWTMVCVEGEAP